MNSILKNNVRNKDNILNNLKLHNDITGFFAEGHDIGTSGFYNNLAIDDDLGNVNSSIETGCNTHRQTDWVKDKPGQEAYFDKNVTSKDDPDLKGRIYVGKTFRELRENNFLYYGDEKGDLHQLPLPIFGLKEDTREASGQGVYSGKNIFLKTWLHYQTGGRKALNVSTSSLDFSFVSEKDLVYTKKTNTYSVNLFSLNKFNQTSLALGRVSLTLIGNNRYTINKDYYDFNIEWDQGFSTRNIGTFGAGLIHGPVIDNIPVPFPIFPFFGPSVLTGSGPYMINFEGEVFIKP